MPEKYFLITKRELLDIGEIDATANRIMEITVDVLSRPQVEKDLFAVLAESISNVFSAIAEWTKTLDFEQPKKKGPGKGS